MRISDWSSDVCSSDLAAGAHQFHRAFQMRPGGEQDHRQVGLLFADGTEQGHAFRAGGGVGAEVHVLDDQIDAALRDARQPLGRSEEHTSELQSLMRISYAVFCLKNKK